VIGVLIVGFNRPDLLEKRFNEVVKYAPTNSCIHVSIDGPRVGNAQDLANLEQIIHTINRFQQVLGQRFTFTIQPTNLGCDLHIYRAISEAIKNYEAIICLEDDIEIASLTLSSMIEKYDFCKPNLISGMSAFQSKGKIAKGLLKNKWRRGKYFSAWGYLVSKEFWKDFQVTTDLRVIESKLENSSYWKAMPEHKRTTWLGRFQRGNIDYQIQLEVFSKNIEIYQPIFRIIENTGLGDPRATHTYHKRPKSMFGRGPSSIFPKGNSNLQSTVLSQILTLIDSNTWAGDGILSVRGRSVGVRTLVKRMYKRATQKGVQQK
jgi:hypothetical protein